MTRDEGYLTIPYLEGKEQKREGNVVAPKLGNTERGRSFDVLPVVLDLTNINLSVLIR